MEPTVVEAIDSTHLSAIHANYETFKTTYKAANLSAI